MGDLFGLGALDGADALDRVGRTVLEEGVAGDVGGVGVLDVAEHLLHRLADGQGGDLEGVLTVLAHEGDGLLGDDLDLGAVGGELGLGSGGDRGALGGVVDLGQGVAHGGGGGQQLLGHAVDGDGDRAALDDLDLVAVGDGLVQPGDHEVGVLDLDALRLEDLGDGAAEGADRGLLPIGVHGDLVRGRPCAATAGADEHHGRGRDDPRSLLHSIHLFRAGLMGRRRCFGSPGSGGRLRRVRGSRVLERCREGAGIRLIQGSRSAAVPKGERGDFGRECEKSLPDREHRRPTAHVLRAAQPYHSELRHAAPAAPTGLLTEVCGDDEGRPHPVVGPPFLAFTRSRPVDRTRSRQRLSGSPCGTDRRSRCRRG